MTLISTSTGQPVQFNSNDIDLRDVSLNESQMGDIFNGQAPDYLTELPGECTSQNCVTIGDKTFLVDWDSAPDWFEYVDSNGNIQRKPTSPTDPGSDTGGGSGDGDVPGGCFGNCYPGGGSGGNDGGNDSGGGSSGGGNGDNTGGGNTGGGSTGGGSSGGGSGGGSSGGSDGDNTGGGSTGGGSSVPDFEFDDSGIIEAIGSSGESTQRGLDAISNDLSKAIGDQTNEQKGMFEGLGETITNALDGIVDSLAEKFTEEVGEGDDLFDASGLDQTLDGVAEQEQQYNDDVNSMMDEIGDGSSSGIADQVTSRLPSLPSGSCTPLQFGLMEISCKAHNTIKLWLSWIIYFWTVVSIVDTFFRSGQRTA